MAIGIGRRQVIFALGGAQQHTVQVVDDYFAAR